ncbi:MAG: FHA domain-containing protein [Coriobacteriales bacterium]
MIDVALWIGRILLIALLYLFLFALMRTGIRLVSDQRKKEGGWTITVEHGPKELKGVKIKVSGPVVVGRSPGADIVIGDSFVSGKHARFTIAGNDLLAEDLQSTNGTLLNGQPLLQPTVLHKNDMIVIGDVQIKVGRE